MVTFALQNFEGPIELLLHLVQKNELDIYEVPVHILASQFLSKLADIEENSLDAGAEFIGTAASLLYLKSKMLLPKHEQSTEVVEEEDLTPDPRFEIIHHLIDYCRFKQAAKSLTVLEDQQSDYFTRGAIDQEFKKPLGLTDISLDDLASMFQVVLSRAASNRGVIQEESWRVSDKIKLLRQHLKDSGKICFHLLFTPDKSREELIVTFLAVLELMKLGDLWVAKDQATQEVSIRSTKAE